MTSCPGRSLQFVTFPRSGHHWAVECLRAGLGWRLVYNGERDHVHDYGDNQWVEATKSHDYGMTDLIRCPAIVVVQTRGFEPAYASWCEYEERRRQPRPTEERWRGYHDRFMEKWISRADYVIPYELLVNPAVGPRVLTELAGRLADPAAIRAHWEATRKHPREASFPFAAGQP